MGVTKMAFLFQQNTMTPLLYSVLLIFLKEVSSCRVESFVKINLMTTKNMASNTTGIVA
jgi:hypothetical protein